MFLIIMDAHSKWIDVHIMQSITATKTIEKISIVFATRSFPCKVATDNGPSFMSDNGVVYVTTAPYHPSSKMALEMYCRGHNTGEIIEICVLIPLYTTDHH